VMTTESFAFPLVALSAVILGMTLKIPPLGSAPVDVVTVTAPVVPAGTFAVRNESEITWNEAGVPPIFTLVVRANPVPTMLTVAPTGPERFTAFEKWGSPSAKL